MSILTVARARTAAALLGAVLVAACGDSPTSPAEASVVGTYVLRTINGAPPPAVVGEDASLRSEITGGSMTLNADLSFVNIISARFTSGSLTSLDTDTLRGTYVRAGSTVTFTEAGPGASPTPYKMEFADGTLTRVVRSTYTLVYRR